MALNTSRIRSSYPTAQSIRCSTSAKPILDPGDEVIIPEPFWVSYPELVQIAGGVPVMVHGHEENDFLVSADDMKPYITPRTKAIILNSPNNPNGCVWPREMLEDIARLAVENRAVRNIGRNI